MNGGTNLVELIAQADERGLAASGLACLDRCVPVLGCDEEILRPLWSSLVDGEAWDERLKRVRAELDPGVRDSGTSGSDTSGSVGTASGTASGTGPEGEAAALARRMLATVPDRADAAGLRGWADACSVAALRIHRLLDASAATVAGEGGGGGPSNLREGRADGASPLVAAELRRQITVLELLADHGAGGLRAALDLSTEGRRVLRAVVSRRARAAG
ncbi:hypothetical protein ACFV6E_23425 [Streptomyces sp. NPDC059785]|uniref:hypothetical protein n=1 Tax=unclassified Streptomyces TaxID=2593676 RepID=UPI003667B082